jgi:hypothetical protein
MAIARVVVAPSSGQVPVSSPSAVQVAALVTVHAPYWWVCAGVPPSEQAARVSAVTVNSTTADNANSLIAFFIKHSLSLIYKKTFLQGVFPNREYTVFSCGQTCSMKANMR